MTSHCNAKGVPGKKDENYHIDQSAHSPQTEKRNGSLKDYL